MSQSKLASAIAALGIAAVSTYVPLGSIPESSQGIIAGVLAIAGGALFPALRAQFDEQKAQLFGVLGIAIAAGADWLVLTLDLSDTVQAAALLVINGAAALLLPALHLQQATTYRAIVRDSRPVEPAAISGERGEQLSS